MEKSELILGPIITRCYKSTKRSTSYLNFPEECLFRWIRIHSLKFHVTDVNITIQFFGNEESVGINILLYPYILNKFDINNILHKGPIDIYVNGGIDGKCDSYNERIKVFVSYKKDQSCPLSDLRCEMIWSYIDSPTFISMDLYSENFHFNENSTVQYFPVEASTKKILLYSTLPLEKKNISFIAEFDDEEIICEYSIDDVLDKGVYLKGVSSNMIIIHYDCQKFEEKDISLVYTNDKSCLQLYVMFL